MGTTRPRVLTYLAILLFYLSASCQAGSVVMGLREGDPLAGIAGKLFTPSPGSTTVVAHAWPDSLLPETMAAYQKGFAAAKATGSKSMDCITCFLGRPDNFVTDPNGVKRIAPGNETLGPINQMAKEAGVDKLVLIRGEVNGVDRHGVKVDDATTGKSIPDVCERYIVVNTADGTARPATTEDIQHLSPQLRKAALKGSKPSTGTGGPLPSGGSAEPASPCPPREACGPTKAGRAGKRAGPFKTPRRVGAAGPKLKLGGAMTLATIVVAAGVGGADGVREALLGIPESIVGGASTLGDGTIDSPFHQAYLKPTDKRDCEDSYQKYWQNVGSPYEEDQNWADIYAYHLRRCALAMCSSKYDAFLGAPPQPDPSQAF